MRELKSRDVKLRSRTYFSRTKTIGTFQHTSTPLHTTQKHGCWTIQRRKQTTQNQHQQQNKSQVQIHPANLAIQLGNITDPSLQKALVNAVCDNEQALTIFTKLTLRLNKIIVKEQREFDTRLPLELQNFTILSKVDTLTTILSNNNFTSTQELVQQIPTNQDVLEKLRRLSTVVSNAYKVAIQARLATKNIGTTCRTVVLVGNRDLLISCRSRSM